MINTHLKERLIHRLYFCNMNIFDFEAYLFDMDGVIADSNPTHKVAFKQFLAERGIDCTDQFFEKHIAGNHNQAIFTNILGDTVSFEEKKNWGDAKEATWRQIFAQNPTQVNGAIDFVKLLHAQGKPLAVCTSAPAANMDFVLDNFDIRKYFKVMLSEADVEHHKPNPEVYLKAAALLGVNPINALVLEDSEKGAAAGLAAGCKVLTVNNSKLIGAPYYKSIIDFTEILENK